MKRITNRCLVIGLLLAVMTGACGDDRMSPTGPTPVTPPTPQVPQVAGTYAGTMQGWLNDQSLGTYPAEGTVTQSGSRVTIDPTVGANPFGWESTTGTVSADGTYVPDSVTNETPTCGLITERTLTIRFNNNTLRIVDTYTATLCGRFHAEATLTKQ